MTDRSEQILSPYVARLATEWLEECPGDVARQLEGTLAFVDISGFTRLTEMLAEQGKAGAEEMTGYLDTTFAELLGIAYANGGELIKWGGDAVLVWYSGEAHAERAVDAAWRMQRTMERLGRLRTSAGRAVLRMSVGIHSGRFHFFSVGTSHRELIVTGPAATLTAHLEAVAEAGEIVVSADTARLVGSDVAGATKSDGFLITARPRVPDSGPPRPPAPVGQPSKSLPATLRDYLEAAPLESEHRQVAVAFVEFAGVDSLLAGHGADVVGAALDTFLTLVQDSCTRHGVTFWETDIAEDGGKIMLVSGAPTATEDDAGSILAAASEIVEGGGPLRVRVGVNCGRVFTGGFGPPYRRTYSAKGDAINLAARLMGRAGSGQVFASEAVVHRSRVSVAAEELEPFLVKGKTHPVHAFRVDGIRAERRTSARHRTSLVGREKELRLLRERLESAVAGRGSCIELVGAPGLGKSRLIEEVEHLAGDRRVLGVVCDEYRSAVPYASMGSVLRQSLDIDADSGPEPAGAQLAESVDRLAPQLRPWIPLLASVVGATAHATPESTALDERFRQERMAQAVLELLTVVIPEPALFVVDDSQWMDDASSALLQHLAGAVATRPWLVLVGRRSGGHEPTRRSPPHIEPLEIEPLGPESVARLIRALSGEHPLVPHQRDAVADRSGGNPLFLIELINGALHQGAESGMPDTVEGLFAAQIDRLAPKDRRLLRVASVLGLQVGLGLLQEVMGEPFDASRLLGDFLEPEGSGILRFRHKMLREAAYEGLSYARRRELHARAGQALERRAGGDTLEIAGLLAIHFGNAGDHRAAWRYACQAAAQARSVHASVEAATYFAQALQAGRAIRELPAGDLLDVAESLGDSKSHLGEFAAAEASFRAARGWAATPLDRARLQYKAAVVTERAGNFRKTLQMLTVAERTLASEDSLPLVRLRAEIRAQYGLVRHRQGRGHDAVDLLREAVTMAERAEAPDVVANALLYLDIAELTAGMPGDGHHARRALDIQSEIGDNPWLEARALNQLGIRAYFAGRWSEAVAYYADSRAACKRAGDTWTAAAESGNIGEVLADQGHLTEAEPVLEEALETFRAAGTPTFVAEGSRVLGRLVARRGDPARSQHLLAVARAIYESDGEALQVVLTDAVLAESLLRTGQPGAAAELARQALNDAESLPGRHLVEPLAQRVLGVALRAMGRDESEARKALDTSIEVARRHDARYELALSLQAVSELWPEALPASELLERDEIFDELGVIESARHLLPAEPADPRERADLPEVRV